MRLRRTAAVVLPLVLLAPLAGVVGPASAAEESTITITGKPKRGVFHDEIGPDGTPDRVLHRGRLTADGEPVAQATVHLERQLANGDVGYVQIETDEDGRYRVVTEIHGNAQYRVVYDGDAVLDIPPAESGTVRLKAMRDFNAGEPIVKRKKAVFKGNINPGWEGKVVHWERKKCKSCSWEHLAKQTSGDNGSWRFAGGYPPVGKRWVYRAWIRGTDEFVKSYSARMVTTTTVGREPTARTARR